MNKYTKTRGHHCWWLNIDGEAAANFDNESDVDGIINMHKVISGFEMVKDIWLPTTCSNEHIGEAEALHKLRSNYLHLLETPVK